jgi:hypothetical protein
MRLPIRALGLATLNAILTPDGGCAADRQPPAGG